MIIFFILGLLLGGISVLFAFQNSAIVAVTFLFWQVQGSLSVIIILSILMGILITLLLTVPELFTSFFQVRKLISKNKQLEDELRKQKEFNSASSIQFVGKDL
jgi:uncharacterized integral membrane protein